MDWTCSCLTRSGLGWKLSIDLHKGITGIKKEQCKNVGDMKQIYCHANVHFSFAVETDFL